MDVLTPEQRRRCMAAVRGQDTTPELCLRRALHALGFRYRLHDRSLPGVPDLVFSGKRTVIFVHGCFWHRHDCDSGRSLPLTRVDFWQKKLTENRERDVRNMQRIRKLRWRAIVVWECQLKGTALNRSLHRVVKLLNSA